MNNPEPIKDLTTETKPRKKKILTDLGSVRAKCKVCLEVGNWENMLRHAIALKNSLGVVLYGAFEYVYFCGESCKVLFLEVKHV